MSTVSVEVAVPSASQQLRRTGITRLATRSILAACVVLGCAITASAATQDDGIGALRSYVTEVAAQAPLPADASIAALKAFVSGTPAPTPGAKVADADNLFDALRQWNSQGAVPAPLTKPANAPKHKDVAATYVGNKTCLGCHSPLNEQFEHTLMGRLQKQGKLQCESCHGAGSEHARLGGGRGVGGIISFRANDPNFDVAEGNQICLGCHLKGERVYWPGSVHETRGVACTNCHEVMKPVSRKNQLKTAYQPDTCFQCHQEIKAKILRSSHMPVREGKMVCSDCHNPHGAPTEKLLRTATVNETCYKCHAEKRGPFLFEHAPVRENCLNCHDPHGSVNEAMLKVSRPRLCTECHAFGHGTTAGPLVVQAISRACNNCHTEVHGTNSPSGALLHR